MVKVSGKVKEIRKRDELCLNVRGTGFIITYDANKVTLHSKLLQGHCKEFEFDDVHTLYANLAVRR